MNRTNILPDAACSDPRLAQQKGEPGAPGIRQRYNWAENLVNRAQHFIPQLYLRLFTDQTLPAKGKQKHLWIYEKGKAPRHAAPDKVAHKRDFYTFLHDGQRNNLVDEYFQSLESARVQPVLREFAESGDISVRDKDLLSKFIGTLSARVPLARLLVDDIAGWEITNQLQKHIDHPEEFRTTFESLHLKLKCTLDWIELRGMLREGARLQQADPFVNLRMMLDLAQKYYEQIASMHWAAWHSDSEDRFVTSDNPVVSVLPEDGRGTRLGGSWSEPNIQLIFPLSPTSCLFAKRGTVKGTRKLQGRRVRQVNKALMGMANRWVFASENSYRIASVFDRVGGTGGFSEDFYTPAANILHRT